MSSLSNIDNKQDIFLFASLDSKKPLTARKTHIRRLYDVLQICIHRNDLERARRAWSTLARCKEIHWMTMWTTGLFLLGVNADEERNNSKRLEYLRTMMLRHQDDREHILSELVIRLIHLDRHKEALDELELYLPSYPYQDNPILHMYAGMIYLYLSKPTTPNGPFNAIHVRDAQSHFEHARVIDSNNAVAQAFLEKIPTMVDDQQGRVRSGNDSEDDDNMVLDGSPMRKRVRT